MYTTLAQYGYGMPYNMMGGWCFGGGFFLWILILILFAVFLTRFLSKDKQGNKTENQNTETVMDILKKRYAKGEIDKTEYDKMKKELS